MSERYFYGREWGMYGRADKAPHTLFRFTSRKERDAWVRAAASVSHYDCGARDPLTADDVRRFYCPAWVDDQAEMMS
jgi:hypothetical protein